VKPIKLPKALVKPCHGGHDVVRDSQAMWITDDQWIPARYRCIVCGWAWDEPTEKPTDPQPSRFHAE